MSRAMVASGVCLRSDVQPRSTRGRDASLHRAVLADLALESDARRHAHLGTVPRMRWVPERRPTTVDIVVAAALTLATQVEIWAPGVLPGVGEVTGSRPVLSVTTLAMTLPLALRRTAPVAVLVVVFGAAVVQSWLTTPTEGLSTLAAMLVAAYSSSAFAGASRATLSANALHPAPSRR